MQSFKLMLELYIIESQVKYKEDLSEEEAFPIYMETEALNSLVMLLPILT